jgi:ParB family chromosome partitioning protein
VLIDETEEAASIRAWTPEQKAACGVVVSLSDGELRIQRGVQKKVQEAVADGQESTGTQASLHVVASSTPDVAEGISVPLLKKCRPRERWRYRRNWCGSHRKPWP